MKPETINLHRCGYAFPGTYGHECGKPATLAAPFPSENTIGGIYWGRRCAECAEETGPDNQGRTGPFVPFDPVAHRNVWK